MKEYQEFALKDKSAEKGFEAQRLRENQVRIAMQINIRIARSVALFAQNQLGAQNSKRELQFGFLATWNSRLAASSSQ